MQGRAMVRTFAMLWSALLCGAAAADAPRVVASIPPVHSLVAGVMEGIGTPALLVPGAASPHAYALKPSDARTLERADVVFWIGQEFESFLAKSLATLAGGARRVSLSRLESVHLLAARGRGGRRPDPHLWLDPENARRLTDAAAGVLGLADPENAAAYRRNARRVVARLDALEARMRGRLARFRRSPFFTFHDGFQYFERAFGLEAADFVTVGPDRPPGARRLRDVRRAIGGFGATCVFSEPQFQPRLLRTLVEGTDARIGILDPLGAGLDPGPDLYFRMMERNVDALAGCLAGAGDS